MVFPEVFSSSSSSSSLLIFVFVAVLYNVMINVSAFCSHEVTELFSSKQCNNDYYLWLSKKKENEYVRKHDRSQVRLFLLNAIREQMVKDDDESDSDRIDLAGETSTVEESDAWESMLVDYLQNNNGIDDHRRYQSPLLLKRGKVTVEDLEEMSLWDQIRMEAREELEWEEHLVKEETISSAFSVTILATNVLSHGSLCKALTTLVSHEMDTDFMPATALRLLFQQMLHQEEDLRAMERDVLAVSLRSASRSTTTTALDAVLFHPGLHALVAHRLAHRLWLAGRDGMAMYIQSTSSRTYGTDIHPAATLGHGIFLGSAGPGVVIGETAVVQNDTTILQGVTLGGTGKEAHKDRHPKIGQGVFIGDSATVLGNIQIGDGAVITAKSIVTKPVPPLARVSGIPAKVKSFRTVSPHKTTTDKNDTQPTQQ